jgi:putative glutamine amidotransferase
MAPLVAVTCRVLDRTDAGDGFREDLLASPRTYLDALHRAGAVEAAMLAVPIDGRGAHARLARVDALLLTGGADVDPARYGQPRHPETYGVSAVRDGFEEALVRAAIERRMPVLAICRGIQVLNVALGGTLVQHLPDVTPQPHRPGTPHPVTVVPGSRLHAALGVDRADGLSSHHQAVDRLGAGLVVTARADDGTVEAVELTGDAWVVAVQWHPEDTAAGDPAQQRVFDAFVEQAATWGARIPT